MHDLTIENHMVIGDYYTDGKVARAERLDTLIRDAEFLRSWDGNHPDMRGLAALLARIRGE